MNGFSQDHLTFAITKNSLESNSQWMIRIFKDVNNRWPRIKSNKKIMIISSKKNTLNGNATHCKNISEAWRLLSCKHDFSVIFGCSNSVRINNILEITEKMQTLKDNYIKPINIIHDEAHNKKEGIPAYRNIIENIILQPIVNTYTPCTASNNSIINEKNPLWKKTNIEKHAWDYTKDFDETLSSDNTYSSCQNSNTYCFEELSQNDKWQHDTVSQIPKDIFVESYDVDSELNIKKNDTKKLKKKLINEIKLYKEQSIESKINIDKIESKIESYSDKVLIRQIEKIYIERKRTLEFCQFMKNDKEKKAVNYGINALNMNEILNTDYYQKNKFNIHIISTPRRNCITRYLSKEALKKEYKPIVLAIYGNEGSKYHLFYDNNEEEVSDKIGKGEFNDKLHKLVNYLKENNININRPFIIIGNYNPTGESLTFVNYEYGTIRGNIRLISTDMEEDYQEACRSNYMNNKFVEEYNKIGKSWQDPDKYLIGEKDFINNAISYEKENDSRITDDMKHRESDNNVSEIEISIFNPLENNSSGTIAAPIKLTIIDDEDDKIDQFREIMCPDKKKNKFDREGKDKKIIMTLLKECIDNGVILIEDYHGKFNFNEYTLKDVRCWKKKYHLSDANYWKFESYKIHHESHTPLINNPNGHKKGECEIYCSLNNFKATKSNGEEIRHSRNIIYIGYKY